MNIVLFNQIVFYISISNLSCHDVFSISCSQQEVDSVRTNCFSWTSNLQCSLCTILWSSSRAWTIRVSILLYYFQ